MLKIASLRFLQRLSLLLMTLYVIPLYAVEKVTITIEGVKDQLLDNVRAYLSLEQQKEHPHLSANRIKRLHQLASDEIKQALQPFGYYQVVVTATLTAKLPENTENNVWNAHYTIQLGKAVTIHHLIVKVEGEGEAEAEFKQLLATFPMKVGAVLDSAQYDKSKQQLQRVAMEQGYFDAKIRQNRIQVDVEKNQAQIFLIMDTGPRYRFGKVDFQQEILDESLLQRFLTFRPGDFYSAKQLLTFKNLLTDSGYFDSVDIKVHHDQATPERQIPIEVQLVPRQKLNYYSFAIGYGTDTGTRGSLGWERRRINRHGHTFKAEAQLSEIRESAVFRYLIPSGQQPSDYLTLTTLYKDETTKTQSNETFSTAISQSYSRALFALNLREVIGLEYRDEKYQIGSDHGHARLLMPSIDWSYAQADDYLYPRRGHKIQWVVRGALDSVGSNASFIQTYLNATVIRQWGQQGRVIMRGTVGYSEIALMNGNFNDLPPSIRFFAGGDRSVRGYDYESLGPKNIEGQNIGGRNLLVGSLEYEHRLAEKWSIATFIDSGNAFNGLSEPLKQGVGVGVRWQSPVGLIRIDIATATSEPDYPIRLHLTVGPDL